MVLLRDEDWTAQGPDYSPPPTMLVATADASVFKLMQRQTPEYALHRVASLGEVMELVASNPVSAW